MTTFKRAVLAVALASAAPAVYASDMPASTYVFDASLAADMFTTLDIKHHPGIAETNPLLGRRPSDAKVVGYFAAVGVVHRVIVRALLNDDAPAELIDTINVVGTAIEISAVASNFRIGLRFSF